jgi:hypothetical protein
VCVLEGVAHIQDETLFALGSVEEHNKTDDINHGNRGDIFFIMDALFHLGYVDTGMNL